MLNFILFILLAIVYLSIPKSTSFFKFIHLKKHLFMIILIAIMISIVIFSSSCYMVAKDAFMLWVNNVIPSLLPFFICIDLLKHTSFIKIIGKLLTPIMKPLFGVPGSGAFAIAMGITSGYPTGAKVSAELYSKNECNKTEAERLLAFTNTSGPLFIIGAVGIGLFQSHQIGLLLLLTHFLASLTVGLIFRKYSSNPIKTSDGIIPQNSEKIKKSSKISANYENLNSKNIGFYMGDAIQNSISTILLIGGYIVFFAVLGNVLKELKIINFIASILNPFLSFVGLPCEIATGIVDGLLEVTGGLKNLSNILGYDIQIITLSAFLLGFGGISVLMQTASIISNTDLSIKSYVLGKLLHGIIAAVYTFTLLKYTSFFSLNAVSTFNYSTGTNIILNETSGLITSLSTLLLIAVTTSFLLNLKKKYDVNHFTFKRS